MSFEVVTKRFGDNTVVQDFSLDVADQEFLVLLGPSGCGKSTALRMIAGLEEPTSGSVLIDGERMNGVDPRDRDIAMVFQSYALYPHMTVARNIEAPLLGHRVVGSDGVARKLTRPERDTLVHQAADTLGLTDYLDRKPGALSGGQRQRVALARAIVREPRVFLLDEPLSNLDAKLRAQTRIDLVELWRRLAATIVYVTHDQVEAMTMATRIAVMSDGRLQQVGSPDDVYHRPANLMVARFIGSPQMSTFEATLAPHAHGTEVLVGPDRIGVVAGDAAARVGDAVVAGVRSEHLRLATDGVLRGVVRVVEKLGYESHIVCEVNGDLLTVRQGDDATVPSIGDEARIAVDSAGIHLFDAVTGVRLP